MGRTLKPSRLAVAACFIALLFESCPVSASALPDESGRAVHLLNSNACAAQAPRQIAQTLPTPAPATPAPPAASPTPQVSPTFPSIPNGPVQLYASPIPGRAQPTPPPLPTPSPTASPKSGPVFLQRPHGTPAPITPAGQPTPTPSAEPTAMPTLEPGQIAVLSDQLSGNTNEGQPGDLTGNVNIFYQDGIVVGDRAHYDGQRTIAVTGNAYIINRERNTILHADVIKFDRFTQVATLVNGRGESTQGVERGEIFYTATNLTSNSAGDAHGDNASLTTCTNARAGYHITGRTIDVRPGDRITLTKVVLYLGAAAIFYLPRVVIPLRQVDEARKPGFFPEFGYNQYEGFYEKAKLGFGHDDSYYGYYRVNYFTRVGLGLGYLAFFARKNGKRKSSIDYYGIKDRRTGTQSYNINATDTENFSRTLRGQAQFSYNGNYGPFTFLPPSTTLQAVLVHATDRAQQNYTFNRSAIGTQSNIYNLGFNDQRQLTKNLSQSIALSYNTSQTTYGDNFLSSTNSHINTLTQLITPGYNYQLTFDKSNADAPSGVNKLPELHIQPNVFLPHFKIPASAQLYVGSYQEPQDNVYTSRADLSLSFGPALYHFLGSDFSAAAQIEQYAYGTGDLKARIQQNMSLQTPVGSHFVNSITYQESNNNGPASVPFQSFDVLSGMNQKSAYDVARIFNRDYYNLQVSTSTLFSGRAQPFFYQLTSRPSRRSLLILGGSFNPGPGLGFSTTNAQVASPFGRNADIAFITDIDWRNKGRLTNKNIYYHRIIGDCYEIRVQYNETLKQVNVTLDLLAFPSRAATFGVNKNGPILPGGLNF